MKAAHPTLYILSGLPGSGKSTLGQALATERGAVYLRIDTIEQRLRDFGVNVSDQGYVLSYRIAEDNLRLGLSVVADSCNPIEITRRAWRAVAKKCDVLHRDIEVICSDRNEHRRRVEQRTSAVEGLRLPTWSEVEGRRYEPWMSSRIVIDTAGRDAEQSIRELLQRLA